MNDLEIVAYCRVSTQEQGISGLGMAAQRQAVSRFCSRIRLPHRGEVRGSREGRKDRLDNRLSILRPSPMRSALAPCWSLLELIDSREASLSPHSYWQAA